MGLIRRPFGIDERDLQAELDRKWQEHEAELVALQRRIDQLRARNRDLRLQHAEAQQQAEQVDLAGQEMARLQGERERYRALRQQIAERVLAILQPVLQATPTAEGAEKG